MHDIGTVNLNKNSILTVLEGLPYPIRIEAGPLKTGLAQDIQPAAGLAVHDIFAIGAEGVLLAIHVRVEHPSSSHRLG